MAKDKDKQINPATAARKAEKAKAVKKGKAAITQQRNDRLAKVNPHRIQSQIDDLKALEANHSIKPREKKQLDDLERELARVIKAKEAAGEKYIPRKRDGGHEQSVLGKRGRGEEEGGEQAARRRQRRGGFSPQSSDTDPDVGDIPMPRDTPPPIPRRRKEDGQSERKTHELPDKVDSVPSQAVYESKPMLRDFVKEAVAFVPAAVRKRQVEGGIGTSSTGTGTGAGGGGREVKNDAQHSEEGIVASETVPEAHNGNLDDELRRLQEEEERWKREKEAKQVTMEEVEDEDA